MTAINNSPSWEYFRKALEVRVERNVFSRYNQLRLFVFAVEHLTQELLVSIGETNPRQLTFPERVRVLSSRDVFPPSIVSSLNNIVAWRNVASHNADAIRKSDIELVMNQVQDLFSWYLVDSTYGPSLSTMEFEKLIRQKPKRKVFLSYASEDRAKVEMLYANLTAAGYSAWMDKKDLLPGQNWEREIRNIIKQSDAFIACLSKNSITKRGFIQKEIKFALDVLGEIPPGKIFFIPIRFEPCDVPDFLSFLHWIDLDNDDSYEKIFRSIDLS